LESGGVGERSERCKQREVSEGGACTAVGYARERPGDGNGGLSTNGDRRRICILVIPCKRDEWCNISLSRILIIILCIYTKIIPMVIIPNINENNCK
jgi:hypothetical protein